MAPTLFTSPSAPCNALPPEGAAAPAARQSRFRGPCLKVEGPLPLTALFAYESTGVRHVRCN